MDIISGVAKKPPSPVEPASLDDVDGSVAALLDEAENIINAAGPQVLADLESERGRKGRFRRKKKRK